MMLSLLEDWKQFPVSSDESFVCRRNRHGNPTFPPQETRVQLRHYKECFKHVGPWHEISDMLLVLALLKLWLLWFLLCFANGKPPPGTQLEQPQASQWNGWDLFNFGCLVFLGTTTVKFGDSNSVMTFFDTNHVRSFHETQSWYRATIQSLHGYVFFTERPPSLLSWNQLHVRFPKEFNLPCGFSVWATNFPDENM